MTARAAAELLGVTPQRVYALLASKLIKGKWTRRGWAVNQASVETYRDSPNRKPGKRARKPAA